MKCVIHCNSMSVMFCQLRKSFGVCISLKELLTVCSVQAFVITLGYYMLIFPFVYYLFWYQQAVIGRESNGQKNRQIQWQKVMYCVRRVGCKFMCLYLQRDSGALNIGASYCFKYPMFCLNPVAASESHGYPTGSSSHLPFLTRSSFTSTSLVTPYPHVYRHKPDLLLQPREYSGFPSVSAIQSDSPFSLSVKN